MGAERVAEERLGTEQDVVELAPITVRTIGGDLIERRLHRPASLLVELSNSGVRHGNPNEGNSVRLGIALDPLCLLVVSLGDAPDEIVDSIGVTLWVDNH